MEMWISPTEIKLITRRPKTTARPWGSQHHPGLVLISIPSKKHEFYIPGWDINPLSVVLRHRDKWICKRQLVVPSRTETDLIKKNISFCLGFFVIIYATSFFPSSLLKIWMFPFFQERQKQNIFLKDWDCRVIFNKKQYAFCLFIDSSAY